MPGYTIDILASSNLNKGHHPRLLGVSAMMRHGSGKSASNTGAEDSTRAADGFWANPATDTGGAGESANTKNDAKDGAGTRLSVSARAAQPPRRGSETRVGFRGVRRRKSGARSDPKTGLGGRSAPTAPSRTQTVRPEFCMNNPCSTVIVRQQGRSGEIAWFVHPGSRDFDASASLCEGSRYVYTASPRTPCICAKLARCKNQGTEIRFECAKPR